VFADANAGRITALSPFHFHATDRHAAAKQQPDLADRYAIGLASRDQATLTRLGKNASRVGLCSYVRKGADRGIVADANRLKTGGRQWAHIPESRIAPLHDSEADIFSIAEELHPGFFRDRRFGWCGDPYHWAFRRLLYEADGADGSPLTLFADGAP